VKSSARLFVQTSVDSGSHKNGIRRDDRVVKLFKFDWVPHLPKNRHNRKYVRYKYGSLKSATFV